MVYRIVYRLEIALSVIIVEMQYLVTVFLGNFEEIVSFYTTDEGYFIGSTVFDHNVHAFCMVIRCFAYLCHL